jgi:hypothetical protein
MPSCPRGRLPPLQIADVNTLRVPCLWEYHGAAQQELKELRHAITRSTNQLALSHAWGSGTLSSSDGQRFPVSGRNRRARRIPRQMSLQCRRSPRT